MYVVYLKSYILLCKLCLIKVRKFVSKYVYVFFFNLVFNYVWFWVGIRWIKFYIDELSCYWLIKFVWLRRLVGLFGDY